MKSISQLTASKVFNFPHLPFIVFSSLAATVLGSAMYSEGFFFSVDWYFGPTIRVSDDLFGLRGYDEFVYAELPFLLFLRGLNFFVPGEILQRTIMFSILLLSGLSAYKLLSRISPEAGYFAGTLYMVNPFVYVRYLSGQWGILMAYSLIPLAILMFIAALENPKSKKNLLACVISSTIVTLFSLHMAIIIFVLYAFLLIARVIRKGELKNVKDIMRTTGLFLAFYLSINTYWIIPVLTAPSNVVTQFSSEEADIFSAKSEFQTMSFTIASLHGFWRYYAYEQTYNLIYGWQYWAVSFIILSIIGFVYRNRTSAKFNTKYVWGIAGSMIASTIFAMGTSGFFEPLYVFLFDNFILVQIFRDTHKLVIPIILGYCILGGLGLSFILGQIKMRTRRKLFYPVVLACIIALPLVYQFNMLFAFNGKLSTHEYPMTWYQVNDYLNADREDFAVLFFPWHSYMHFKWAGHIANPAKMFFDKPVLQASTIEIGPIYSHSTNPAQQYVQFLLSNNNRINNFGELVSSLNIKYILLTKESDYSNYRFLYNQTDLQLVFDNSEFSIFANKEYVGRLYVPADIIRAQNFEDLLQQSKSKDISRSAIITSNNQDVINADGLKFEKLEYSVNSPVRFVAGTLTNLTVFSPPNFDVRNWVVEGAYTPETFGYQALYVEPRQSTIQYDRFDVYLISYCISATALAICFIYCLRNTYSSRQAKILT
jgi:Alpha-(1->3)-arabinofuranosyltransferase